MSYYARGAEVRQIDPALFAAWVAASNPKATGWAGGAAFNQIAASRASLTYA